MKAAVYTGTKNLYKDMLPSINSLLKHSDVDKIYLLIEDDIFPYQLPNEVECINISDQTYFVSDGPNYNCSWTYMVLIRAALSKIFPQLDKILSIDVDTIVNENISELWNISLDNYYLAACKEAHKSTDTSFYVNMGVALINLKKMREDHKDDEIINAINTIKYPFAEQDCINEFCKDKILILPSDYNINNYTKDATHRKIIHFAAIKEWQHLPLVEKYRTIKYERNEYDIIKLDIIIPTYNDVKGLEKTLTSIPNYSDLLTITVVNDCSTEDYSELELKFPYVNFLTLKTNSGPGIARQYGIEHTNNSHIMFIDSGDYLLSHFALLEVLHTIKYNTIPYLYQWRWLNEEHQTYSALGSELLHGRIYKREFLELYNITFCEQSAFSNEDIGFNHLCGLICKQIRTYDNTQLKYFSELPIYMYIYNKNSITHKNNKEFYHYKQVYGLITNIYHVEKKACENNVDPKYIMQEICLGLIRLYYDLLKIINECPQYVEQNWQLIRKYYNTLYCKYKKYDLMNSTLHFYFNKNFNSIQKLSKCRVNITGFLNDLKNNEFIPIKYLTQIKNFVIINT